MSVNNFTAEKDMLYPRLLTIERLALFASEPLVWGLDHLLSTPFFIAYFFSDSPDDEEALMSIFSGKHPHHKRSRFEAGSV